MAGSTPSSNRKGHGKLTPNLKGKKNCYRQEDHATPSPKRQRTTRASTSGKSMSYDMKYHPMDDVLRPAASAARKAAHGIDNRSSSAASESPTVDKTSDGSDGSDETEDLTDHDHFPTSFVLELRSRRPTTPKSGSSSGRRATRADVNGERVVMYDMKYHPMDQVIRPAAARKVLRRYLGKSEGAPSTEVPCVTRSSKKSKNQLSRASEELSISSSTSDVAEGSDTALCSGSPAPIFPSSSIAPAADIAPRQSLPKDMAKSVWKSASDVERSTYLALKGAPVGSCWNEHTEAPARRDRYVDFQHRIHEDFGAGPEPGREEDWKLHYAEDFDVYDCDVHDRYPRYRVDRTTRPMVHHGFDRIADQQKPRCRNRIHHARAEQYCPGAESDTTSDEDGHGLNGSYNDAEGYLQQVLGPFDDDDPDREDELIASMRNSVSASTDDVFGVHELTPMFASSANSTGGKKPIHQGPNHCMSLRFKNKAAGANFSVHEDEPRSTPKIRRQVAMNPKSPGTDLPKENLRERSASEEDDDEF
ncbi:MAG: hypothetical protein Q9219_003219 [cf. Caloplaca sp. 3 TL-2023]